MAVGAIEPPFYAEFLELLDLDDDPSTQLDAHRWPELKRRVAAQFLTRSRSDWEDRFAGSDACVSPVLGMGEAPDHPHHRARETFVEVDGVAQPGPGPRFDRTQGEISGPPPVAGQHTDEILEGFGFDGLQRASLREVGAVR
jgi:alpha-methylacyl-CoA racemase